MVVNPVNISYGQGTITADAGSATDDVELRMKSVNEVSGSVSYPDAHTDGDTITVKVDFVNRQALAPNPFVTIALVEDASDLSGSGLTIATNGTGAPVSPALAYLELGQVSTLTAGDGYTFGLGTTENPALTKAGTYRLVIAFGSSQALATDGSNVNTGGASGEYHANSDSNVQNGGVAPINRTASTGAGWFGKKATLDSLTSSLTNLGYTGAPTISASLVPVGTGTTFVNPKTIQVAYKKASDDTVPKTKSVTIDTNGDGTSAAFSVDTDYPAASTVFDISAGVNDAFDGVTTTPTSEQADLVLGRSFTGSFNNSMLSWIVFSDADGDFSDAQYDGKNFSFTSQTGSPVGIFFKDDGTKMYMADSSNREVHQYSLSTAFNVESATFEKSKSTGATASLHDVFFRPDGTEMYVAQTATGPGTNNESQVTRFTLTTAWDIGTATDQGGILLDLNIKDLFFKSDGTKFYEAKDAQIREYPLSTAWDLGSRGTETVLTVTEETAIQGVHFKSDGTEMYIVGFDNDTVYRYSLSTAWSVSSATFVDSLLIVQEATPTGLTFSSDDSIMYVVGNTTDSIYSFPLINNIPDYAAGLTVETMNANKNFTVSDLDAVNIGHDVTVRSVVRNATATAAATTTLYNRGEAVNIDIRFDNAFSVEIDPDATVLRVHNSAEAVEHTATADSTAPYTVSYTTSATDTATADLTGSPKHLHVTFGHYGAKDPVFDYTATALFNLTSLLLMGNAVGSNNGIVNTDFEIYNRGEVPSIDFFVSYARGVAYNKTLTSNVLDDVDTVEDSQSVVVDGVTAGKYPYTYTIADTDKATNDFIGSPKKLTVTVDGNNGASAVSQFTVSRKIVTHSASTLPTPGDPSTADSGVVSDQSVYNRGESPSLSSWLFGARGQQWTRTIDVEIKDGVSVEDAQSVAGTSGAYSWSYTIANTDKATWNLTGQSKFVLIDPKDGNGLFQTSIGSPRVSRMWQIASTNAGPDGTIYTGKAASPSSDVTTTRNRGQTLFFNGFLYNVRGELLSNESVNFNVRHLADSSLDVANATVTLSAGQFSGADAKYDVPTNAPVGDKALVVASAVTSVSNQPKTGTAGTGNFAETNA